MVLYIRLYSEMFAGLLQYCVEREQSRAEQRQQQRVCV